MDQLKLPDAVRIRLGKLYQAQNDTIRKLPEVQAFESAAAVALEFLGLEPGNHGIDFQTGIVTPASSPNKPTLVKDEAAS